jgi:hypothetical protein
MPASISMTVNHVLGRGRPAILELLLCSLLSDSTATLVEGARRRGLASQMLFL